MPVNILFTPLIAQATIMKQIKGNIHILDDNVNNTNANQQLAMTAEEAAEKVKSLSKTLKDQNKGLKDLDKDGINSKSLIKLGEWDKKTGSFKKNKQEMQQLVNKYNELKAAREQAGGKKAIGEEASIRGKLGAILRQQKQHAAEIVAQNQAELKSAKEISAAYKESSNNKNKLSQNKIGTDTSTAAQNVEQLTQKLGKAKSALTSLKNGLSSVATTKLGDSQKVLKAAGRTETLKQLVALYEQLATKKKEFEDSGISKQSVSEMNSMVETLNKAKQTLIDKGLFGLSETGLGDIKGRLANSSQSLDDLVSQYRELLITKQKLEQSGDVTSENYTSTISALKGVEDQLKVLRQDQIQEVNSKVQGLKEQVNKKTEYLNVARECKTIEDILADVHKNQLEYAQSRVTLYEQQIAKAKELLQIEQQHEQENNNQSKNILQASKSNNKNNNEQADVLKYGEKKQTSATVKLDVEKVEKWVNNGAKLTDTVKSLLASQGVKLSSSKKAE